MTSRIPFSSPKGRRAGLTSLLAGALVGVAALSGLVSTPATAVVPQFPASEIELLTGATNTVTFGDKTQTLSTAGPCRLSTADDEILTFAGLVGRDPGDVSLQVGSIGVAEKPNGTSCYQVNADKRTPAETLVIGIDGAALRGQGGLPVGAFSATLDLELKGDAIVNAFTRPADGSTPPAAIPLTSDALSCKAGTSDSGPDAKEGDNCIFAIEPAKPFDQLTLVAVAGSFSLEGGSDWPASNPKSTTFTMGFVADGQLYCPSSDPTKPSSFTVLATSTAGPVTIARLDNADPTQVCQPVPYALRRGTLANGQQFVQFLKPLASQTTAQFVVDVEWTKNSTSPAVFTTTTVNWESSPTSPHLPLGWCPNPTFNSGDLTGIAAPPWQLPANAAVDQDATLAGVQYACLGSSTWRLDAGPDSSLTSDDRVKGAEQIYLLGDIFIRR